MIKPWEDFKPFLIKNIDYIQYDYNEHTKVYHIWVILEGEIIETYLKKDKPEDISHVSEWETYFKPRISGTKIVKTGLSSFNNKTFYSKGFRYKALSGETTLRAENFGRDFILFSGHIEFYGNFVEGDKCSILFVDVDNVYGMGNWTPLSYLVEDLYMMPTGQKEYRKWSFSKETGGASVPSVLYLGLMYTSNGVKGNPENDIDINIVYEVW